MKQEFLDATDLKLLDALQHDATLSNVALAERLKISPPTCLRRVKRLTDEGWIERQIAVLNSDKLGATLGHSLTALVEVTLDIQGAEHLDAFEKRACFDAAVQQCWRVSPGPDFVLVVQAADMPDYLAITQRLLTQDANVRNVKSFFATKRAKFTSTWPVLRQPSAPKTSNASCAEIICNVGKAAASNKSLSPLTKYLACALSAVSMNLSSSGSRQ